MPRANKGCWSSHLCVWYGSVTMYTMFQNVPLEKSIKDQFPNYNLYVYGEGYVFHMMLLC